MQIDTPLGVGLHKPTLFLYPLNMAEKIDWTAARTAYITGSMGYRDIAAQFGVHRNEVAEKGKREGWVEARKKHREQTVSKACQIASRAKAKELAKIYEASNILDEVLVALLLELKNNGLEAVSGNGTPGRELESLSKAILNNDELKRRLHGILLPRDEERLKLDREKLEMDKRKLEAEQNSDNTVKVVLTGDLEEYSK